VQESQCRRSATIAVSRIDDDGDDDDVGDDDNHDDDDGLVVAPSHTQAANTSHDSRGVGAGVGVGAGAGMGTVLDKP
jgi:hypothetical protein